jgi:hypothetical protein
MLAGFYRKISKAALAMVLLWVVSPAVAGDLSADAYLALKKTQQAVSPALAILKADVAGYIGKTVEVKGTVTGSVKCDNSLSFILDCGDEALVVKTGDNPPTCITNGSTLRALVKIGVGCFVGLSDLKLVAATHDWIVSAREREISAKAKPAVKSQIRRDSDPKNFRSAVQGRGDNLSSRAMQIYQPYRNAIASFNPKLSKQQLDTITKSVLLFSEHYGVDPRLVVALILAESGFKPEATSRCGAMGLGQLMPGTARGLGVSNAYDPVQNIGASIKLMRGHLDKYGDIALALSAYNAGPGAVKKYRGIPPYKETRNYVSKVSQIYYMLCGK